MDTIVPGALSAFVVDCTIFPLDTIKSRVQAEDYKTRYPNGRGLYKGLWQGFGPVVVATLPSAALFFTTYEYAKATLTSPSAPLIGTYIASQDWRAVALAHGASSALAELASCLLLTPAETIKQQRQVALSGSHATSTAVWRSLSPARLWQGYWALASRNLPFTAMQFPLYEFFRGHLANAVDLPQRKGVSKWKQRAGHQEEPRSNEDVDAGDRARQRAFQIQQQNQRGNDASTVAVVKTTQYAKAGLVSGASAAGAGAISALLTTPLDLVKTRIMLASDETRSGAKRPTFVTVMRTIWQREGLAGLMRGAALRSTWTALGAGIYLGSYEAGREWWGDMGKEQAQEVKEQARSLVKEVEVGS